MTSRSQSLQKDSAVSGLQPHTKRLEQFYNQVASGVLDKAEKSLENTNKKHTGALNNSIQALNEATNRLNLKLIFIFASTFVAVMMVFILAIFLYIPSKDEIDERRADMAVLKKYPLQIRESDGETLVRIMRKNCYSFEPSSVKEKTYDWCQIDPKKY